MGQFYLITLSEQADNLCDDLFEMAVRSLSDAPHKVGRICKVLEHAMVRGVRRKEKAGLLF